MIGGMTVHWVQWIIPGGGDKIGIDPESTYKNGPISFFETEMLGQPDDDKRHQTRMKRSGYS